MQGVDNRTGPHPSLVASDIVHQSVAGHPLVFLVYPGRRPVLIDEGRR